MTQRHIALVAHDNVKSTLLSWARRHRDTLAEHVLYATGTTGTMLAQELDLPVHRYLSGPVGGDQQIGARIAEGGIDVLVFFWDPLEAQPHDPDVKALLRIGTVWNVPMACNVATADLLLASPLLADGYERALPEFRPRGWGADGVADAGAGGDDAEGGTADAGTDGAEGDATPTDWPTTSDPA